MENNQLKNKMLDLSNHLNKAGDLVNSITQIIEEVPNGLPEDQKNKMKEELSKMMGDVKSKRDLVMKKIKGNG